MVTHRPGARADIFPRFRCPVDERLFLNLNRHWIHPVLDWTMALASSFAFWAPLLVALVALVAWRGGERGRLCLACVLLAVGLTELTVAPLKRLFARPRPNARLAGVRQVDLDRQARPRLLALGRPLEVRFSPTPAEPNAPPPMPGRSFPSGHVMDNFAAATMLSLLFRRWGRWSFALAALVGYSRIYTGSHWPSDVLLSALFSIGLTLCIAAALELLWRRQGPRWLPEVWRRRPSLFGRLKVEG